MESSPESRCGEIASDLSIILVTAAQLVFFTRFHKYIAWYTRAADGGVNRISLLTDDYFDWLPFPTLGSILVIVASCIMIIHHNYWFRRIASILFNFIGITIVVSLLVTFPFDFSVIPNATAADVVPKLVTGLLIFMAVFYGITAIVMIARSRSYAAQQETR
jgi:hypothetical protein